MFARVSTYELEQGRASEAMTAFEPAIDGIRQLEGFVEGFFLVERDGLNAMTVTLWESFDAMERSRIAASRVRSEAAIEAGATVTSSYEYEVGLHTAWPSTSVARTARSRPNHPHGRRGQTPPCVVRDRVIAVIDLRSDTATRPTEGMRAAIAAAEVGDEQRREDPSVTALQERAAALLGQEAALFLPTATMANQIALKLHTRPGDVLVADRFAHVVIYEYGGAAAHAGLMIETLDGSEGRFTVEQLEAVTDPEHEVRRPAGDASRGREHAQLLGRALLAGRRARGDHPGRAGARPPDTPRRRTPHECRGRDRCPRGADRRPLRHGDALPLEGARLPPRSAPRRPGGGDRARMAREAPLRRRDAAGGNRRRGGGVRARPSRRPARRGPRARAAARPRVARGGASGRPRAGADELRAARRRRARARARRGARRAPRGGRRASPRRSTRR